MLAKNPLTLEQVIDSLIESAPSCVRERSLLQSINWANVDAAKVSVMLGRLASGGVRTPDWLAKSLIVAGHSLPAAQFADAPLNILNRFNAMAKDGQTADGAAIESLVDDLVARDELEPDIVVAAVRQLCGLKLGAPAARLALAHWRQAPQSLRLVGDDAGRFVEGLTPARLRVAGFSTTHSLAQDLWASFASAGFRAEVTEADYGQALAALMQPGEDARDALVILLDLDGLHAPDWRADPRQNQSRLVQKLDLLGGAIESYVELGRGPVLINTLPMAIAPTVGLIDGHHAAGAANAVALANQRLIDLARRNSQVILIDANRTLSHLEPRRWSDQKFWYYGRIPFSADATRALAAGFAGAYRALKKGTAKVLALDMDNTLWGGVFGDDGIERLACDDEFPGNVFKAFQHECLRLKGQGMLLTVLSKNNPDAITVFQGHPGMLLKDEDFVATRINWAPKPLNVRSMAEELNLGLDSFVFIDDSPHEREAMRRMCPEVTVPELPADPATRPQWLRNLSVTWPLRLTAEDSRRSDMYVAERQRTSLRDRAVSYEDYLRDLNQTLTIENVGPNTIARAAQMHLRTNQFNLTTERYDDAAIKTMMQDDRCLVVLGRALDKFGDHGLVICGTARVDGEDATVASFLMSCRVIAREIETTFLGEMLNRLASRGVRRVKAAYIPTKKNDLVKNFYRDAGLEKIGMDGTSEIWSWDLTAGRPLPGSKLVMVRWEN